jgi:signal transduction histidine kinase/GAF domain-containing protein
MPDLSLPLEKALKLSVLGDELLKSIFYRDRRATLEGIVSGAHGLLNAESCGIFLVPDDAPLELLLEADYSDMRKHDFDPVRLRIESRPGGGLTGHIAKLGKITNVYGPALREHESSRKQPARHLRSGRCYSFLSIPLKDRKGRLRGVLNAHNKKDTADGEPQDGLHFDSVDEAIARILANKIVLILESHRVFSAFRDIMQAIYSAKTLEEITSVILAKALTLLAADRGDMAWWDEAQQNLILLAREGESTLNIGQIIPPGFIQSVWARKDSEIEILAEIKAGQPYVEFHPDTRSEIAAILDFHGRRLGVLNAESFRSDGFDDQDIEILRLLAGHASVAAQLVQKEARLRSVVQDAWESSANQTDVLKKILRAVRESFGLDAGMIYIADHVGRILRSSELIGCENLPVAVDGFSHGFDAISFASKIFRTRRSQYSAQPWNDPDVDKSGLAAFDIRSPMVGAPLVYRDELVGVLLCWTRTEQSIAEEQKEVLAPFARIAAQLIALSQLEDRRSRDITVLNNILQHLQPEPSVQSSLTLVLEGLQKTYFDRARYYEWDEEIGEFVGLDCVGMNRGVFVGHRISVAENQYAKDVYDRAFTSAAARKYESAMLGPDPESSVLGKDPEKPWAVVPVVVNRKIYGYFAADNALSGRSITQDALDFMGHLGAIAGQVISSAGNREQFLVKALHTIRTPAHSIQGLASQLISVGARDPNAESWLNTLDEEARRLARLTKKVGRFSRSTMSRTKVSLSKILLDSVSSFRPRALRLGTTIMEVVPSERECFTMADYDAIRMVFDNLLENALAFSVRGDTIMVELAIESPQCRVTVSDQGPGVAEEHRARIFKVGESFPLPGRPRGSGVGLPIARQIMDAHGGTLDCVDPPSGRGACFCFKLNQMR